MSCPVLFTLFRLSSPDCPVLVVLSYSCCHILTVLFCSGCHILVSISVVKSLSHDDAIYIVFVRHLCLTCVLEPKLLRNKYLKYILAVLSVMGVLLLFSSGCAALASCPGSPSLTVLSLLSCPGSLVIAVLDGHSCLPTHYGCSVLAVQSWLPCSGCHTLEVLFQLFYSGCPVYRMVLF